MDYIKELEKLRNELLETQDVNAKMPYYKMLAYKKALESFTNQEYKDFCSKVLGMTSNSSPLKIDLSLKNLALGKLNENTTFKELEKIKNEWM